MLVVIVLNLFEGVFVFYLMMGGLYICYVSFIILIFEVVVVFLCFCFDGNFLLKVEIIFWRGFIISMIKFLDFFGVGVIDVVKDECI